MPPVIKNTVGHVSITFKVIIFQEFLHFMTVLCINLRVFIFTASAMVGGGYGVEHSFGSLFEHILNQEGTRFQQELGNAYVFYALL